MALLKPREESKRVQQRINIKESLIKEIGLYCEFVGSMKLDEFFKDAASYILTKDKDFKEWLDNRKEVSATPITTHEGLI